MEIEKLYQKMGLSYPSLTFQEVMAIKALDRGEATKDQQTLAISCIVKKISGFNDQTFRLGDGNLSSFYQGRRDVGVIIINEISKQTSKLREKEAKK